MGFRAFPTAGYRLRFQIGARTLFALRRELVCVQRSLDEVLDASLPALPPLGRGAHGYLVSSLPAPLVTALAKREPGLRAVVRQHYTRYHADLDGTYDSWLARLSSKTRSTLLRKRRRFADQAGGIVDVRSYRSPEEIEHFHALARPVSRRSYQERLLDAGLPEDAREKAAMLRLAAEDGVRAFLLFLDGEPISYLYLPAEGDTLLYAYLGYDPVHAGLSPGAVLQLEAMRLLMEEGRFRRLDFTEGEGQHKRIFSSGGTPCVDLMLLKPSLGNALAVAALAGFDTVVAAGKRIADAAGLQRWTRALRR